MHLGVQVSPRLEVAYHYLRCEVFDQLEVGLDLLGYRCDAFERIRKDGRPFADAVLFIEDVQPVDSVYFGKPLAQKIGCARGGDDFHLAPARK